MDRRLTLLRLHRIVSYQIHSHSFSLPDLVLACLPNISVRLMSAQRSSGLCSLTLTMNDGLKITRYYVQEGMNGALDLRSQLVPSGYRSVPLP